MNLQTRISQQSDSYVARRVVMEVLGMTKEEAVISGMSEVGDSALEKMDAMMQVYDGGKPLAYVLGYEYFDGHRFVVDERVLIPRAETEELVTFVAESLQLKATSLLLIDMGTGSGCVGLSIMERMKRDDEGGRRMKKDEGGGGRIKEDEEGGRRTKKGVWCVLCDVSEGALEVAQQNIDHLCHSGLDQKSSQLEKDTTSCAGGQSIVTKQVDVMRLADDDQGLDEFLEEVDEVVIVANLPYIPVGYEGVEHGVQTHEPHLALYSGADGLEHYRALLQWVSEKVEEGGKRLKNAEKVKWTVWIEMMADQVDLLLPSEQSWRVHQTFHPNIVMVEYIVGNK